MNINCKPITALQAIKRLEDNGYTITIAKPSLETLVNMLKSHNLIEEHEIPGTPWQYKEVLADRERYLKMFPPDYEKPKTNRAKCILVDVVTKKHQYFPTIGAALRTVNAVHSLEGTITTRFVKHRYALIVDPTSTQYRIARAEATRKGFLNGNKPDRGQNGKFLPKAPKQKTEECPQNEVIEPES